MLCKRPCRSKAGVATTHRRTGGYKVLKTVRLIYNKHLIRLCYQCYHDYLHCHRLVCLQKMRSSGLTPAHLTQPLFQAEALLKRALVWYIMVHPHNRLFNNKMGWTIDSQSRLDETQGHYTKWNERKGCIPQVLDMTVHQRQNLHGDEEFIPGCQGWGVRGGCDYN